MSSENNEKTQEELRKEAEIASEERKKEWESLIKNLEDNSDEPATKGELVKALHFIEDDLAGIAQMVSINAQNSQVLNHNFQAIAQAISGGQGPGPNAPRTQGGIILP